MLHAVPVWGTSEDQTPASVQNMDFPLPDKPSFAILPFDNMSKDPDLEYLSDGFADTLTLALYKVPGVFVMDPDSTDIYKGKSVTIKEVAEELAIQYLIKGGVEKSGDKLGITVRMIDALKGKDVWSERYDRNMEDIFEIQNEIFRNILKSAGIKYQDLGPKLAGTNNLDAYLKYLEANKYSQMRTKDSGLKAKSLYEEAIAIDPGFSLAYCMLSYTCTNQARYSGSDESRKENFDKALELAEKAIKLDNSNSYAYVALGYNNMVQKNYDTAISCFQKAIQLNPLNLWANSDMGACLHWSDKAEDSVQYFKQSIRLNPMEAGPYLRLGRVYYHLRQYEDAIKMYKKCSEQAERGLGAKWWAPCMFAMVYAELGQEEEARSHMKKLLELWPSFNLEDRRKSLHFKDPAINEREIAALRKAGAPEKPPLK